MASTKVATKRPPAEAREAAPAGLEGLTVALMSSAAEIYWPGLGAKVADQWREWNDELFDGKLRPAPMVLSRMSSVHGHWFPLLDSSASQVAGTEVGMVTHDYAPPQRVTSVSRAHLLRGMMQRLREQDGVSARDHNSEAWCALVMQLHRRLTGATIWAAPEVERMVPAKDLGKGLYEPAHRVRTQAACPETGKPSLPKATIAGWPGTMMDLGYITRD